MPENPDKRDDKGRFTAGNDSGFQPGNDDWKKGLEIRQRKASLTKELLRVLDGDTEEGREIVRSLIHEGIENALSGDFRFWREIWDRIDGKTVDRIGGPDAEPLLSPEDRERISRLVRSVDRPNDNGKP